VRGEGNVKDISFMMVIAGAFILLKTGPSLLEQN